jgi:hypothetical protein
MRNVNLINVLLLPVFTVIYSIIGLLYFNWGVFHIVYLFWFENLIKIFFYRLKVGKVEYVLRSGELEKSRDEFGKLRKELKNIYVTRLFMYFTYFVFIVIGLGIVLPLIETDIDIAYRGIYSFVRVFNFKDWEFNFALISCLLDELMTYIRDFKKTKIYTKTRPYVVPLTFERADVILHLTILISMTTAFFIKHPESPVFGFTKISPIFLTGLILSLIIFVFQIISAFKQQKEELERGTKLNNEVQILKELNKISTPKD